MFVDSDDWIEPKTCEECYEKIGGNYAEVSMRLPNPRLIERFVGKFLEDNSYEMLCTQIECRNRKEAFLAAHALKGVCANLSFSRLMDSVSRLTEVLRPETSSVSDHAIKLFGDVKRDYEMTAETIRSYLNQ